MPKFYCEYCGIYLTHSSPSGRKQHSKGRKHVINKIEYYNQFLLDQNQQAQALKPQTLYPFSKSLPLSLPRAPQTNFGVNPLLVPGGIQPLAGGSINVPGIMPTNINLTLPLNQNLLNNPLGRDDKLLSLTNPFVNSGSGGGNNSNQNPGPNNLLNLGPLSSLQGGFPANLLGGLQNLSGNLPNPNAIQNTHHGNIPPNNIPNSGNQHPSQHGNFPQNAHWNIQQQMPPRGNNPHDRPNHNQNMMNMKHSY